MSDLMAIGVVLKYAAALAVAVPASGRAHAQRVNLRFQPLQSLDELAESFLEAYYVK